MAMASVDRRLVAIVAVGLLVIVAALAIVFLAIVPIPEFNQLEPGQESGYVAYLAGDDEPQAVHIVSLTTLSSVTADVGRETDIAGWDDNGNLVIHDWRAGDRFWIVDPTTGATVETATGDEFASQGQAFAFHEDGEMVLRQVNGEGSARFPAPESYDIRSAVSMGDDTIVFVDELGRVAMVGLGEDVNPLLIASDAVEWSTLAARTEPG